MDAPIELPQGARLELTRHEYGVTINLVQIPADQRGTGKGSEIMRDLIRWADTTGTDLYLTPAAIAGRRGLSTKVLTVWYRKLGFITHGKHKESRITVRETMVRYA